MTGYVITFSAAHHKTVTVKVKASARKAVVKNLAAVTWSVEVQAVNKYGRGLPATNAVKVRS